MLPAAVFAVTHVRAVRKGPQDCREQVRSYIAFARRRPAIGLPARVHPLRPPGP